MSDEEKQAIFKLREIIEYDKKHRIETIYDKEQIEFRNNIELMLNLVEKLKKEIEELKNKVIKRDNEIIQLEESAEKEFLTKQEVKENYIPKDKIEKIKNKNIGQYMNFYREIEELLEEE